jgi:transposase
MVGVLTEYWNYRGDLEIWRKLLCLPQRKGRESTAQRVRAQRRLSPEDVAQLAAERQAGAEINELAEQFGVHRATVIHHLRRAEVDARRYAGRTLSPERIQAAGELYAAGASLVEVGERLDVDRRYLRRVLPDAGFLLRPPGRKPREGKVTTSHLHRREDLCVFSGRREPASEVR